MDSPKSWNDRSVFESEEPFLRIFKQCSGDKVYSEKEFRLLKNQVLKDAEKVKSLCEPTVVKWIEYAFSPAPFEKQLSIKADYPLVRLFFEFYCTLCHSEIQALEVLNRARLARGLSELPFRDTSLTGRTRSSTSKTSIKDEPSNDVAPISAPSRWKSIPTSLRFKKTPSPPNNVQDAPLSAIEFTGEQIKESPLRADGTAMMKRDVNGQDYIPPLAKTMTLDASSQAINLRKRTASTSIQQNKKKRKFAHNDDPSRSRSLSREGRGTYGSCTKDFKQKLRSYASKSPVASKKSQILPQDTSNINPKRPTTPPSKISANKRGRRATTKRETSKANAVEVKLESSGSTLTASSTRSPKKLVVSTKRKGVDADNDQIAKRTLTRSAQRHTQLNESTIPSDTTKTEIYSMDISENTESKGSSENRAKYAKEPCQSAKEFVYGIKEVERPLPISRTSESSVADVNEKETLPSSQIDRSEIVSADIAPSFSGSQIIPRSEDVPLPQSSVEHSKTLPDTIQLSDERTRVRRPKGSIPSVEIFDKPLASSLQSDSPCDIHIKQEIFLSAHEITNFSEKLLSLETIPAELPGEHIESDFDEITDFPSMSPSLQDIPTSGLLFTHSSPTLIGECLSLESHDTKATFPAPEIYLKSENDQSVHYFLYPTVDVPPAPPRPPLVDLPPIWAQSRQEICESFDWFRSYQGGVYHVNDYVKGYLLSGFPSSRDRFEHEGRLIISHGGGKAESIHSNKGVTASIQASDQLAQDKSVRALLNNYQNNRPLALLIDNKYALFPYDLDSKDVTYAVLGFYTVAYFWAEYQTASNDDGRVVRYKFAFRWCEEQGQPWWILRRESEQLTPVRRSSSVESVKSSNQYKFPEKEQTQEPSDGWTLAANGILSGVTEMRCNHCCKISPKVFRLCWVCLVPECSMFWRQTQCSGQYLPDNLDYEPDFLLLPPCKAIPPGFDKIEPPLPIEMSSNGTMTNYYFTRGFHCFRCGRLSCRSQWEQWQCLHCNTLIRTTYIPRHAADFANQALPILFKDYFVNGTADIAGLSLVSFCHEGGRSLVRSFILPDGRRRGKIHHIQARSQSSRKDADAIFLEYQEQAASGVLKFRRWPMRAHKCRGALLTNYFSHNAGKPYKYVGGDANTVPFESAPAVCRARDLIQKRIGEALGVLANFNEVLSAAYMEKQRMAFHSDNEVGLGPLVAGLSLGSPALMHFRIHARHDPERERRGILLTVVLRHGDVLVMDGAGVQDYYEHTVVPSNFRIAATARQIGLYHE